MGVMQRPGKIQNTFRTRADNTNRSSPSAASVQSSSGAEKLKDTAVQHCTTVHPAQAPSGQPTPQSTFLSPLLPKHLKVLLVPDIPRGICPSVYSTNSPGHEDGYSSLSAQKHMRIYEDCTHY